MEVNYLNILDQVKTLSQHGSEDPSQVLSAGASKELREDLDKLILALRTPGDIIDRTAYSALDSTVVRLANDLGIFKHLNEHEKPMTEEQLAKATGADEYLIGRILRFLTSVNAVAEIGTIGYVITKAGKAYGSKKGVACLGFIGDVLIPTWQSLPAYLAESGYRNPTNHESTSFHKGLQTDAPHFQWISQNPQALQYFNDFMSFRREGRTNWLDFFPIDQKIQGALKASNGENDVVFVDVGGAVGADMTEIFKRYPGLKGKGRMILQDLPRSVERVAPDSGFEAQAHDFFTPQPIKGAHFYHMHHILHDWPDSAAIAILRNLVPGLQALPSSKLLIQELVIPDHGERGYYGPHSDMNMMALVAGAERTEQQWHTMLNEVGLQIEKIWTAGPASESVIEASLKT